MLSSAFKQDPQEHKDEPLIPEVYLDFPSQRLYYLSLGALCQSIKLFDLIWLLSWSENRPSLCRKWIIVDCLLIGALSLLHIPRLTCSKATLALFLFFSIFLDGLLFGGISLNVGFSKSFRASQSGPPGTLEIASNSKYFSFVNVPALLSFGLIQSSGDDQEQHLSGQHTVRMSPISTAHLNPDAEKYCLSHLSSYMLLPVLLNNTNTAGLKYSVSPLNAPTDKDFVNVTAKDLEKNLQDFLQLTSALSPQPHPKEEEKEDDEYDDDDDDEISPKTGLPTLQKSQSLVYIRISKPGIFRLEQVWDIAHNEARVIQPSEVVVVPCPQVAFVDARKQTDRDSVWCSGQDNNLDLLISVMGTPPLSLRWLKTINGKRDQYLVEGIEGDYRLSLSEEDRKGLQLARRNFEPQTVEIPLSISLNEPGTHLYVLEEIVDGQGNSVSVGADPAAGRLDVVSKTKTTRSFVVLGRPVVSFKSCNLQNPKPLLIGSYSDLELTTKDLDKFDAPWEVAIRYKPPQESIGGSNMYSNIKPWKEVLKTPGEKKNLTVRANAPGEYIVTGIKGKYCHGDVLAPDVCLVVEQPKPSAHIEWKRIHECSGDTGVSASLILHGQAPFRVYYTEQRDDQPPLERSMVFSHSRGELTMQPDKSGHYIFTFISISDSNYAKVELDGPIIDQVVHPLVSVEFAGSASKKTISSCAGDTVPVDLELKGTGPWNVEFQIIGPKGSDSFHVSGVKDSRHRVQIPIPEDLRKTSGSFEINLVSAEDSYCKRPVSVSGIVVYVKRTWPTAQFYGKVEQRHVTITEGEKASLPLRLTGDGPWRLRYRLKGHEEKIFRATLYSANDNLRVTDQGTYEIIGIDDALCPGSVISGQVTYHVDWIPRPSAKLSSSTIAHYHPDNRSHILPPICEGASDHVDLDLTGRPPFQIIYNIARDSEAGGTKLIDQPTFNSIQPRTRFQLQTSTIGRMYYEVKRMGDSAYPLKQPGTGIIPRSQRLVFEQEVMRRPSVWFKSRNRMTYCQNDTFTPLDPSSSDGIIIFEGTPPFTLTLSIKDIAASEVVTEVIKVHKHIWRLSIPSYRFKSIGSYLVTIESVVDSSHCEQSTFNSMLNTIWVDVAETAAIIPFDKRSDICAGDTVQFQLEGLPPWTVGYRIGNRKYSQEVKTSPFSLSQLQPGELIISSISHQQKSCKATVTDIRYTIHPLPSAKVGQGKRVIQDIHEGDQAEIVFNLVGQPPFAFTYQRSELTLKKGGKPGKVLETHTVSRVATTDYSVFSALEGTWTVASISDQYCRYPPLSPEWDERSH